MLVGLLARGERLRASSEAHALAVLQRRYVALAQIGQAEAELGPQALVLGEQAQPLQRFSLVVEKRFPFSEGRLRQCENFLALTLFLGGWEGTARVGVGWRLALLDHLKICGQRIAQRICLHLSQQVGGLPGGRKECIWYAEGAGALQFQRRGVPLFALDAHVQVHFSAAYNSRGRRRTFLFAQLQVLLVNCLALEVVVQVYWSHRLRLQKVVDT